MPKGVPLNFREKQRRETEKKAEQVRKMRDDRRLKFTEIAAKIGLSSERARQLYFNY